MNFSVLNNSKHLKLAVQINPVLHWKSMQKNQRVPLDTEKQPVSNLLGEKIDQISLSEGHNLLFWNEIVQSGRGKVINILMKGLETLPRKWALTFQILMEELILKFFLITLLIWNDILIRMSWWVREKLGWLSWNLSDKHKFGGRELNMIFDLLDN